MIYKHFELNTQEIPFTWSGWVKNLAGKHGSAGKSFNRKFAVLVITNDSAKSQTAYIF